MTNHLCFCHIWRSVEWSSVAIVASIFPVTATTNRGHQRQTEVINTGHLLNNRPVKSVTYPKPQHGLNTPSGSKIKIKHQYMLTAAIHLVLRSRLENCEIFPQCWFNAGPKSGPLSSIEPSLSQFLDL